MDIGLRIDDIEERRSFFRFAASCTGLGGDYAEFGSCGALTFGLAWQEARKMGAWPHLWAFDSFKGFPAEVVANEHPQWRPGTMAMDRKTFVMLCDHQRVPHHAYTLMEGDFADTLHPDAVENGMHPLDIRLAYINCALYASARLVMAYLAPRLRHSTILGFDNYFRWWAGGVAGERRAFLEMTEAAPQFNFLPWLQWGPFGMSFVVEDRKPGNANTGAAGHL